LTRPGPKIDQRAGEIEGSATFAGGPPRVSLEKWGQGGVKFYGHMTFMSKEVAQFMLDNLPKALRIREKWEASGDVKVKVKVKKVKAPVEPEPVSTLEETEEELVFKPRSKAR